MKNNKPLGHRNYGSIGHLVGSRMGPTDSSCPEGQANICTLKSRDKNDVIIVQEKLDGSNVGVAKINGEIHAITRAGYLASTSDFEQHKRFGIWVENNKDRFYSLLEEGERVCGEWLIQAHGTRYKLQHEPFVVFDIMQKNERIIYSDLVLRVKDKFVLPNTINVGESVSINEALEKLGTYGSHGALDPIEGAVWRVERFDYLDKIKTVKGWYVDFLAKYVRHDKVDGMYLPKVTGLSEVWNKY